MSEILRMKLQGRPEYIMVVKMAVASAVSIEGCNVEFIEEVKIAVGEACRIITCHGSLNWSQSYEVIVEKENESLVIYVKDDKKEEGISKSGNGCIDCPKEGDLGIKIIKSLVDDFNIEKTDDGYKTIMMVKRKC